MCSLSEAHISLLVLRDLGSKHLNIILRATLYSKITNSSVTLKHEVEKSLFTA